MEKQILNIVVSPLIHDNKILLLKRNKQPFRNLWGMPGGKVEFGEHLEDALKRELFEETGLVVKPKKLLAILHEVFFDKKQQKNYWHCILFLYEVVIKDQPELKDSKEGELQWFNLKTLPQGEIIPSDYAMIKHIVQKPTSKTYVYKIRIINDNETFILDYFLK